MALKGQAASYLLPCHTKSRYTGGDGIGIEGLVISPGKTLRLLEIVSMRCDKLGCASRPRKPDGRMSIK